MVMVMKIVQYQKKKILSITDELKDNDVYRYNLEKYQGLIKDKKRYEKLLTHAENVDNIIDKEKQTVLTIKDKPEKLKILCDVIDKTDLSFSPGSGINSGIYSSKLHVLSKEKKKWDEEGNNEADLKGLLLVSASIDNELISDIDDDTRTTLEKRNQLIKEQIGNTIKVICEKEEYYYKKRWTN